MNRFSHLLTFALLCLFTVMLFVDPAFAQADTSVDFTPVINQLLALVAAVLAAVGTWAAKRFATRLGVEIDKEKGEILDNAIRRGIDFARNTLSARLDGKVNVDVESEVLRAAVVYAKDKVPETLAYFNITEARLVEMVKARLGPVARSGGVIPGEAGRITSGM